MNDENKVVFIKVKKYNDADTKKEGSPIETPYKYSDTRRKVVDIVIEEKSNENIE
jgi:hypothetical protein